MRRIRQHPVPFLKHLDRQYEMTRLINDEQGVIEIRGVATYVVNEARTGEFDEMPV